MKVTETYDAWNFRERVGCSSTKIIDLDGKKFKFSYRNGNAFEEFQVEMFDGTKLNHICSMKDLGETPQTSAYHLKTEVEAGGRVGHLVKLGINFIKLLY